MPSEAGAIRGAAAWLEAAGLLLNAGVIQESESFPEAMRRSRGEAKLAVKESRLVILRANGQETELRKQPNEAANIETWQK